MVSSGKHLCLVDEVRFLTRGLSAHAYTTTLSSPHPQTVYFTATDSDVCHSVADPRGRQASKPPNVRRNFFVLPKNRCLDNWPTPQFVIMHNGVQLQWVSSPKRQAGFCPWTLLGDLPTTNNWPFLRHKVNIFRLGRARGFMPCVCCFSDLDLGGLALW